MYARIQMLHAQPKFPNFERNKSGKLAPPTLLPVKTMSDASPLFRSNQCAKMLSTAVQHSAAPTPITNPPKTASTRKQRPRRLDHSLPILLIPHPPAAAPSPPTRQHTRRCRPTAATAARTGRTRCRPARPGTEHRKMFAPEVHGGYPDQLCLAQKGWMTADRAAQAVEAVVRGRISQV
ncbi:hypothetical protein VTK56DRAFT_3628 [Thermocarpiscus australiensis]